MKKEEKKEIKLKEENKEIKLKEKIEIELKYLHNLNDIYNEIIQLYYSIMLKLL